MVIAKKAIARKIGSHNKNVQYEVMKKRQMQLPKQHEKAGWQGFRMVVNYELKGLITNIQDFSVHDGYGIRVLVFLKGCGLRCKWCQNPESLKSYPEIVFRPKMCINCGRCIEVCPEGAIISVENGRIDRSKCNLCMKCIEVCPSSALIKIGKWMSVNKILKKIQTYSAFFTASNNGGVTLSGGDPLSQWEFSTELLKAFQKYGIHTAIETSGYASYNIMKKIINHLDLLLYDIKHMNSEKHRIGTGVTNDIILDNLRKIRQEKKDLESVIRIPLIPGFNEDIENIIKTSEFVNSLGIKQIDLLPFNDLPGEKYREIGKGQWECINMRRQPDNQLDKLAKLVESIGLKVTIGGLW